MKNLTEFDLIKDYLHKYDYFVRVTSSLEHRSKLMHDLISTAAKKFKHVSQSDEIHTLINGCFTVDCVKGCFLPIQYNKFDLYNLQLSLKIGSTPFSVHASVLEHNRPGSPLQVKELEAKSSSHALKHSPIIKIFDSTILSSIKDIGDIDLNAKPPFDPILIIKIATLIKKSIA